jgi:SPP1 gp7 family putative phage head morphogenesis protein
MCEICVNKESELSVNVNRYDPTRTTVLRNMFAAESNRLFTSLIKGITKAIVEEDVFGLQQIEAYQTPGNKSFAYLADPQKIEEFLKWLERKVNSGLLTNWPNKYLSNAYQRGILRAITEMRKAKYKIPLKGLIDGETIPLTLSPHINTLELLHLRTFTDLKGITEQMGHQISRILSEGFLRNQGYKEIAKKLVATINGKGIGDLGLTDLLGRFIPAQRRAEILARTEIVRAHHLAMINEYRRYNVKQVVVMAEYRTAGDERVCAECASLEGVVYTLDEAELIIPRHPLCRCMIVPKIIN